MSWSNKIQRSAPVFGRSIVRSKRRVGKIQRVWAAELAAPEDERTPLKTYKEGNREMAVISFATSVVGL